MFRISSFIMLLAIGSMARASDVVVLTDANFDQKIGDYSVALVKFYAPWCGHCKKMAPEFDEAATLLKANDPPVALIKVDCTVETKICGKHGVNGYPTLKIFKDGQVSSDYQGPREAAGIVKYMRSKAGPSSRVLSTQEEFERFLNNFEPSVIGFFRSEDSSLAVEFKKVADQLSENFRFAHTTNADLLAKYGHEDQVVLYQPPRLQVKLESSEHVYQGSASADAIKNFIYDEIHGLVGHRMRSNLESFRQTPLVIVYYRIDYTRDPKGANYVRNRIIKVAQKLQQEGVKVHFAVSDMDEFRTELAEFGYTDFVSTPKVVVARGQRGEKFKLDAEYSPESVESFARDVVAGRVEPYLKSEPIPTENTDAVKTVVAKNFDAVVNDDSKDVLIEFYAPWCGHCKQLAPKYEELAKKLKDEDDIVIAKMDATANDIPSVFEVRGYPTIYFVPKNSKNSPRQYQGGREVNDFIQYLAKEATDPLKNYDRSGKKIKKNADL